MHFELSHEHQLIIESARAFVEQELYPHEEEVERTDEVRPQLVEQIQQRAIAAGFYAAAMPEELGGGGLDVATRRDDVPREPVQDVGVLAHRTVRIDLRAFGGSALTTDDLEVPKDRSEDAIESGIPITYVPAGNTSGAMLSNSHRPVGEADATGVLAFVTVTLARSVRSSFQSPTAWLCRSPFESLSKNPSPVTVFVSESVKS